MHQKSQSYDVWFLRYGLRKTDFLSYWAIFALLSPNDPKYQNFEKNCREILSFYTYMCTINEDHMIYGFEMQDATDIFFVILGHFLPFYPLSTWTIEILKK